MQTAELEPKGAPLLSKTFAVFSLTKKRLLTDAVRNRRHLVEDDDYRDMPRILLFFVRPFGMMTVADFWLVVVAGVGWCNAIKAELYVGSHTWTIDLEQWFWKWILNLYAS
ncbi:hypothetical protein D5086_031224 [Populus alba]|uniref:Uncharacterized protein n=1 Tax=Populus alba TaxID=43335 RepID=A0ACC4AQP3_POPAL